VKQEQDREDNLEECISEMGLRVVGHDIDEGPANGSVLMSDNNEQHFFLS
jgi:hypothetical protein